jgi:hypothetical protein
VSDVLTADFISVFAIAKVSRYLGVLRGFGGGVAHIIYWYWVRDFVLRMDRGGVKTMPTLGGNSLWLLDGMLGVDAHLGDAIQYLHQSRLDTEMQVLQGYGIVQTQFG